MAVSGKVVHYDANRGFGFLAPESGGADVFLHINDIDIDESLLRPGAQVEFDVEETDRGAKAVNVEVTGEAPGESAPPSRPRRDSRDSHDHGSRKPQRGHHGGGRPVEGALDVGEFTEELTELLLDSSGALTADQIIAIRQRVTDFAVGRGWVLDRA
ncbi:cold-shock protein [Williamsia sterculiae]|uniref:Cold-shock DNA-binding protein family n=1 Tax=Williamsia sterculiae TaxID=1344003 RepID=A0A1N7G7C1_9NOCA|nr:cold shock domain-containing protein [Williamsia sterculiae]SIS08519.1 cold-shock DNA-binding protein family [Williamsia sterculiae]